MDIDIAAYCARVGVSGPLPPTAVTLRRLHHAHMLAVPFENLDIHWGRPIVLEEARLFEKLVTRGRGGFCYEQGPQARADGIWRVQHDGCEGLHSSRTAAGDWQIEYRFRLRPRQLADFTPGCEHHQHSPESHFTRQRVCSLATKTGRITLSDLRLIETEGFPSRVPAAGGRAGNAPRRERDLADEAEFLQLLRERFEIEP